MVCVDCTLSGKPLSLIPVLTPSSPSVILLKSRLPGAVSRSNIVSMIEMESIDAIEAKSCPAKLKPPVAVNAMLPLLMVLLTPFWDTVLVRVMVSACASRGQAAKTTMASKKSATLGRLQVWRCAINVQDIAGPSNSCRPTRSPGMKPMRRYACASSKSRIGVLSTLVSSGELSCVRVELAIFTHAATDDNVYRRQIEHVVRRLIAGSATGSAASIERSESSANG